MTETTGRYQVDERDRLFEECVELLKAIRRKRQAISLLKGIRDTLKLYVNHKNRRSIS